MALFLLIFMNATNRIIQAIVQGTFDVNLLPGSAYKYSARLPHADIHDPRARCRLKGYQIKTEAQYTENLTKQYRAESLDVVALFTKFVDYIGGTNKKDMTIEHSEHVRPLDIKQFKRGDRLLAYTNKAVDNILLKS